MECKIESKVHLSYDSKLRKPKTHEVKYRNLLLGGPSLVDTSSLLRQRWARASHTLGRPRHAR